MTMNPLFIKGASIYNVRKIFGILDPLPPMIWSSHRPGDFVAFETAVEVSNPSLNSPAEMKEGSRAEIGQVLAPSKS